MSAPSSDPGDNQLTFKFVLVGDSTVGKTSLCKMFCEKKFCENQAQTIGLEFGKKIVEVESTKIKLQIWDTAGQERFHCITRAYFRSSAAVFLVYDVTNRESFSSIGTWADDALRLSPPTAAKVLIGNKTDLTKSRAVSTAEAEDFARQRDLKFFETSALSGDKVEDAFIDTVQAVYRQIVEGKIEVNTAIIGARSPLSSDARSLKQSLSGQQRRSCC